MNKELMFSSKSVLWETPQWLYDELDMEFRFTLDVCALPENAKCTDYYCQQEQIPSGSTITYTRNHE